MWSLLISTLSLLLTPPIASVRVHFEECVDRPYFYYECSQLVEYCQLEHADRIRDSCPKTCGLCGELDMRMVQTMHVPEPDETVDFVYENMPGVIWHENGDVEIKGRRITQRQMQKLKRLRETERGRARARCVIFGILCFIVQTTFDYVNIYALCPRKVPKTKGNPKCISLLGTIVKVSITWVKCKEVHEGCLPIPSSCHVKTSKQ